jgi:hypothetical protein
MIALDGPRRKRTRMKNDILAQEPEEGRTWFSKTTTELFRAAVNKVIIARNIVDIRKE